MKSRLLLMICLAAAASASVAQSKVELYGIVDAGVTRVSGLKGGGVTQLASGVMEGSRIGLRGQEDLGEFEELGAIAVLPFSPYLTGRRCPKGG